MTPVINGQDVPTLWGLLADMASFLWKEWPKEDMEIVYSSSQFFNLRGECPHCRHASVFLALGSPWQEEIAKIPPNRIPLYRVAIITQCQGCRSFVLGIAKKRHDEPTFEYETHYPLGKPNDTIAEEIPAEIAGDFKEALRCRWVDAYNATVEMCRRALEASCIEQGAASDLVLSKMIDWVHSQGKITTPLKDMAHKIKLGGNLGAHPSDRTLLKKDADAVIEFTREYFHHVYVMPAKLAKHDFDKPKNK